MRYTLPVILFLILLPSALPAQGGIDIRALVEKVRMGEGSEVAKLLPQLEKNNPDKPGVLFLNALLETNAEKSVELYQRIADEHGDSQWADEALYRLYQYSYAVGAYRTARMHWERLGKQYPTSPFTQRDGETRTGTSRDAGAVTRTTSGSDAATTDATYSVQVGAYTRAEDAEKQAADLRSKGYTATVREREVNAKQLHAVWLGVFNSVEQARAFTQRLKQQQNLDAIVVKR
jgi:hypothetical protein